MKPSKTCALTYLIVLLASLFSGVYLAASDPRFGTNILDLLPPIYRDPVTEHALTTQAAELGKRVVLIVQSPTDQIAEKEALRIQDELLRSEIFSKVETRLSAQDLKPLIDLFLRYPFQLAPLADDQDTSLTSRILLEDATQRFFSPDSVQWMQTIDRDPLLLLPTLIDSLVSSGGRFTIKNGFVHIDTQSSRNVLIVATIKGSAYAQHTNAEAVNFLKSRSIPAPSSLLTSGVIFFAAESASRTRSEVSIITTVTTLCVLALLLFAFRSVRAVFLITAYVAISFTAAFCISYLGARTIQGIDLHLITIGFGSCLIGICVDYAIHYLVAHATTGAEDSRTPLSRVFPALCLGLLTSIVGFLGIAFSPFPGLQQLALFCISGLLVAAGVVVLIFPFCAGRFRCDSRIMQSAHYCHALTSKYAFRATVVALIILVVFGLPRSKVVDDIRVLNTPSPQLISEQRKVADLVGMRDGGTVITIEGASEEEVLQREEAVVARLKTLITARQLDSYRAFSHVIPSQRTQQRRYALIADLVRNHPSEVQRFVSELHLPHDAQELLFSTSSGTPNAYARMDDCLNSGACRTVHDLWLGKVLDRYVTTIPLNGFTGDRAALTLNLEGTRVLNHADAISHALTLYRVSATKLTALFYCAVIVMLMWRYGINRALRIILPSLAGTLASIAALGLFGIPLNVFSVFALMVLLGISIDYAIFFAEDGHNSPTTTYAVLLSAVTTITSFGALVCSSTPALQSFGIVLSVGVLFSALLAPIAQSGASRR